MKNLPKKITEDTREEENDRNVTRTIKKIKVYYLNGSIQEFGKSEWIIYKYCEHIGISTLSDCTICMNLRKIYIFNHYHIW